MTYLRRSVTGVVAIVAATAGLLSLSGVASAADSTRCNASAGQYCAAIDAVKGFASQSVRVNGRCLLGPLHTKGRTHFPSTSVDIKKDVSVVFYTENTRCGDAKGVLFTKIEPEMWNNSIGSLDGRWAVIDAIF